MCRDLERKKTVVSNYFTSCTEGFLSTNQIHELLGMIRVPMGDDSMMGDDNNRKLNMLVMPPPSIPPPGDASIRSNQHFATIQAFLDVGKVGSRLSKVSRNESRSRVRGPVRSSTVSYYCASKLRTVTFWAYLCGVSCESRKPTF